MPEKNPDTPSSSGTGTIGIHLEFEIISTANEFFGTARNITLDSGYIPELDMSKPRRLLYEDDPQTPTAERISRAASLIRKLRRELDEIDSRIDPSVIRRAFERIGTQSTHTLELVIQYYLSKSSKTGDDRDKLDLLATRWGSYEVPGTQKIIILRPAKDLELKLAELCNNLGIDASLDEEGKAALAKLDVFLNEIAEISNFRDIVEGQLVRRLREYKAALDDDFYCPKILAKIIEVNISIHNLFQQLYDSEQARLHLYLEEAKKSAISAEQAQQFAQFQPILKLMNRAAQMDHLIDEIKHVLATHQVLDQTFIDEMERTGRKMRDLSEMIVNTLQNSRRIGEELHKSLSNLQRLEKMTVVVSATEKEIFENLAGRLEQSPEALLGAILENALIAFADAEKNGNLSRLFPNRQESAQSAISFLINAGYAKSGGAEES